MGLTEALEKLLIWEEGFSAIIKYSSLHTAVTVT